MSFGRTEKEFSDLDVDQVDFKNGHWTFGCGGYPLKGREWSISHVAEDFTETRYKLPTCINHIINNVRHWGADEAKRAIRSALGL